MHSGLLLQVGGLLAEGVSCQVLGEGALVATIMLQRVVVVRMLLALVEQVDCLSPQQMALVLNKAADVACLLLSCEQSFVC